MPAPYVLKNSPASRKKLDKVLKTIQDNATSDREEAKNLLDKVKTEIEELTSPHTVIEGIVTVESFTKLIQTAAIALNQMGNANEKLLKLVAVCQKFDQKGSKGKDSNLEKGSFFSELSKLDTNKGSAVDDEEI